MAPVKATVIILTVLAFTLPVYADGNVFTGNYSNQVAFSAGQGTNSGFLIPAPTQLVPFYSLRVQYSQPTTFFKLPARQSINITQTVGFGEKYGWNWDSFSIPILYLTEDIALLHGDSWYFATGAGIGFQGKQNDRLGTKLLFQFDIIGGYKFSDKWGLEVIMQHFSNGNTGIANHSYAFYGAGVTYNF